MPAPDLRRDIGKELRLWAMAVVCAAAGAIAVAITDSFGIGVLVFVATLGVCGPILFTYEKRRKARAEVATSSAKRPGSTREKGDHRPRHGGHRKRPPRRT